MTRQELFFCLAIMTIALAYAFYDMGQTAGMNKAEKISEDERRAVLCKDQPMNVVCLTVHKDKN